MADGKKPPPFFCPACGQKHRADLAPLEKRKGAALRTRCQGCGIPLAIRLEAGEPVVEDLSSHEAEAPAEAPVEAPADAKPDATLGGPYERDLDLEPGTRIGRYEVEALLRHGHTSTIYRAHDPETKRTVALKVLAAGADADAKSRFDRQIEVQGRIRHPNVLPVYDRGVLDDGRPFFAAENLEDPETLASIVRKVRRGGFEEGDALAALGDVRGLVERVLLPIADGIYVANVENGQIHRDLRPENVLVDGKRGRPYAADFSHAAPPAATEKARPVPLSHYTAPETTGHRVHPRTDVWGLGGLLQLVLSGEPPLEGRGRALLEAARRGRVRDLPSDADPALAAIARKALAPDPEQRYVNARQMAADLRAWCEGGTVRAVEEFGGDAAHRLLTRATLVRAGKLALWAVGGLLVGLLIGSRIQLQGAGGVAPRVAAAASEAGRLSRELTVLAESAERLDLDEGARTWRTLHARIDAVDARIADAPPSSARDEVASRTRYLRSRLLVPTVRLEGPAGAELVASNVSLGRVFPVAPGDAPLRLPPGRYVIGDAEGQVALPFELPLSILRQGRTEEPRVVDVRVPEAAGTR